MMNLLNIHWDGVDSRHRRWRRADFQRQTDTGKSYITGEFGHMRLPVDA